MSKELEALERIGKLETTAGLRVVPAKTIVKDFADYYIIETALKDYENLKLKHRSMQDAVLDDFKKLKVLEIIKECFDLNGFDELVPNNKWFESKEKQDLLKEYFK